MYPRIFHQASQHRDKFLRPTTKEAMFIIISCSILGLSYALLWDSYESIVPFINGIVIGLACGAAVAWSELFLFRSLGRKLNFISIFSLKVFSYVFILSFSIFAVILISRSIEYNQDPITTFYGGNFSTYCFMKIFIS